MKRPKPTIAELEKILSQEDKQILIKPDGQISVKRKKAKPKILTQGQNLVSYY